MIKIIDLTIQYNQKSIIEHLNIEFPSKGLVGVYGKSGCGKSSLFQILAGINPFFTGNVYFNEINLKDTAFEFFKENMTYIPQEYNCFEENTVEENILLSVSDLTMLDFYVQRYNLTSLMKQKMSKLSLGEHQRVSLVITFLQRKKINLLDELLCNLDSKMKALALEDLRKLAEESLVLLISHQIGDVSGYCDKLLDLSVDTNWSLSSQRVEYEHKDSNYKLSFLKIKTYGNKVLKGAFISFILMVMAITMVALNIATSSYTKGYMKKVVCDDPLGIGVNVTIRDTVDEYFENVEIPYYDLSLLIQYYEKKSDYILCSKGKFNIGFNFIVLDEVQLSKEKILLKDMEVILPNEIYNHLGNYDADGKYLYNHTASFQPLVHFTEGHIFNFESSNLMDMDFIIRKTYNEKSFYDALREYLDEEQAQNHSRLVIMNQATFIKILTRLLNLQVTLKTPVGDKLCWICPYEPTKEIQTDMNLNDGEMCLSPRNINGFISKTDIGYLEPSATITFSYNDKEYSNSFSFKEVISHDTIPLFIRYPSLLEECVDIYVSYNDFYDIMATLEYDLLEDMKACNRLIDLRQHSSSIVEDITIANNKIIFSNLPLIYSKKAFYTTKQIYSIVSVCLVAIFLIVFLGYGLYNAKELEHTDCVMRNKMYSSKCRLEYIRFKNLFYPILLSFLGILLGLLVILICYFLNVDYFYSIQWQPYLIGLAEILFLILIYFIMEKLKLRKYKNDTANECF